MPAMIDDPARAVIHRVSGEPPFLKPGDPVPATILPRHVTLRDRVTTATLIPYSSPAQVPLSLISYLCDQFKAIVEEGDTYPMLDPMPLESYGPYWFGQFAAVMLLGDIKDDAEVRRMADEGADWDKICLGTFYIKPNYPGRSSHICNAGFIVTDAARNRGVGKLMGEGYLDWAPKLGYTYSVFNLVYETNVASCRIWDSLGFKRIGRVPMCGNLKSYPDQLIDAIIYGRELGSDVAQKAGEAQEERFDKIKYYLKTGSYPSGADRAEKSRLRSAATHYKIVETTDGEEKLTLKGKEVIGDPKRQYEIARDVHLQQESGSKGHAGINKTTASISERYHWERIKATVSVVIKNCTECKASSKPAPLAMRRENSDQPETSELSETASRLETNPQSKLNGRTEWHNAAYATPGYKVVPFTDEQAMSGISLSQLELDNRFNALDDPSFSNLHDFSIPIDPSLMNNLNHDFGDFDSSEDPFADLPPLEDFQQGHLSLNGFESAAKHDFTRGQDEQSNHHT